MKLTYKKASSMRNHPTVFAAMFVALLLPTVGQSQDESVEEIVEVLQAKVDRLTSMVQLERGRSIYLRACAPCHGIRGDGKGPAAQGFDPAPRNFRQGTYKFRTTVSGALPLDKDLERTVREGVPGTEMPRWKKVNRKFGDRDDRLRSLSPPRSARRTRPRHGAPPTRTPPGSGRTGASRVPGRAGLAPPPTGFPYR